MSAKTEGTLVLDGLIEGRLPEPAFAQQLNDWCQLLRQIGLDVAVEIEGGSFNLLATPTPVRVDKLGPDPGDRIRESLQQLVSAFPDPLQAELFSTLRSVEYAAGEEIQTVFFIRPDGTVEAPQRSLDAVTTPRAAPVSTRDWIKTGVIGLVVLAAIFGITSLFVDWRETFQGLWRSYAPLEVEAVQIDLATFASYLEVEEVKRGPGRRDYATLEFVLRRKATFPVTDEQLASALAGPGLGFAERLTLEALARGYVRIEVFTEGGTYARTSIVRVADLRTKERLGVLVIVPRDPRPSRIVLGY